MFANIILIIAGLLLLVYCLLIIQYLAWFQKAKVFITPIGYSPQTTFSIIIPARNEEENIGSCIESIFANEYPSHLFEVIAADDFSEDNTANFVKNLQKQNNNLRLIQLKDFVHDKINSYKKKAIEIAISNSKYEWIITTDADCEVSKDWLQLFDAYIQTFKPVFVAAPVMFVNSGSFLSIFQCLDFISLQGITAASVSAGFHAMCNGANLAYKKHSFYEVNGFKDVDNIASGDDMLLMSKIKHKYSGKIGYLFHPNAIVSTLPMPGWKSFVNQRIRWASKATSYDDKKIFYVLLLVYLFNFVLFILPFISIFVPYLFFFWLILLVIKTFCELLFMYPVAKFFKMQKLLWWFLLMQPFHILYTVVSGWLGKFGKYEWKGRSVR